MGRGGGSVAGASCFISGGRGGNVGRFGFIKSIGVDLGAGFCICFGSGNDSNTPIGGISVFWNNLTGSIMDFGYIWAPGVLLDSA